MKNQTYRLVSKNCQAVQETYSQLCKRFSQLSILGKFYTIESYTVLELSYFPSSEYQDSCIRMSAENLLRKALLVADVKKRPSSTLVGGRS